MYVVCVQVHVKPEFVDDFIKASRANHEGTRTEPGNLRWDLSQSEEDPTRFFIYEVYRTKEDFPRHQQTPHYLKWKETVADWMAEPRVGTRFASIYPDVEGWSV
jgi:(4S)-4-hydroxy-5-phosphonooxypentane-2,3-dione isomerase